MTVIEQAMSALSEVVVDLRAIVTDSESVAELRPLATNLGFETFSGPRDDVLKRYVLAIDHFAIDTVVRATGDNPLVSAELANELVCRHITRDADYGGFLGMPLGTGVETLKAASLRVADVHALNPYEREHVSPYLYNRPESFSIYRPGAPVKFAIPDAKVTLDTEVDYRFLRIIYQELYHGRPILLEELVEWLAHGRKRAAS